MAEYLGDFSASAGPWSHEYEFDASGVLTDPVGATIAARKDNGVTEDPDGLTLTVPFDGRTGVALLTVTFSADAVFWSAGSEYRVFFTAGTLDGAALNGRTLARFSIERDGGALALLKDATIGLAALEALVDDLESRLSATRAGYLDNLNVGGLVAASSQVQASNLRGALATGTADSGSPTTLVDAALTQADADYWKGNFILFTDGSIAGQCRLITAFTPGTDTITFAPATTQAVTTNAYEILPAARVDLQLWLGSVVNALISGRVDTSIGAVANDAITAASIANGAIDAATFAAGAIDNAAFNVTEVLNANVQQWNGSAVATPTVAGVPEVDITHIEGTVHGSAQVRANAVQWAGAATATDDIALKATLAKGTDITGFNDLSSAQVNAEVVDALNVDTYAEPGQGAPPATTSLIAKVGYLFKAWRNRNTATSAQYNLFADDGTTVDQKATLSDSAGTTEKSEIISGP